MNICRLLAFFLWILYPGSKIQYAQNNEDQSA